MTDAVVLAAAVGAAGGVVVTVLLVLARRLGQGARELGSDAEQATYAALHRAGLAAPHLRGGLESPDVARSARHLRALLGSSALVIVAGDRIVATDGETAGVEASALRIAVRVAESGRAQTFSRAEARAGRARSRRRLADSGESAHQGGLEAVGAPIVVAGRIVGVVVAFAAPVRAALVRAVGEVADWCAAQVELGELDASRTALAEAELRALRAQISPHFIYNALTAIASFISTDPPRARELVLEFAEFTRYSFRHQGEFTTLAEELRSIHAYLELERARFGDRLQVRLQIAPESLATVIPFLSVQPLVENAVRHGLEPTLDGGTVAITAQVSGAYAEIAVDDDGTGIDADQLRHILVSGDTAANVGLRNVDRRLRKLYGAGAGVVVDTAPGEGTLVRMRVPLSQPQHETSPVA